MTCATPELRARTSNSQINIFSPGFLHNSQAHNLPRSSLRAGANSSNKSDTNVTVWISKRSKLNAVCVPWTKTCLATCIPSALCPTTATGAKFRATQRESHRMRNRELSHRFPNSYLCLYSGHSIRAPLTACQSTVQWETRYVCRVNAITLRHYSIIPETCPTCWTVVVPWYNT